MCCWGHFLSLLTVRRYVAGNRPNPAQGRCPAFTASNIQMFWRFFCFDRGLERKWGGERVSVMCNTAFSTTKHCVVVVFLETVVTSLWFCQGLKGNPSPTCWSRKPAVWPAAWGSCSGCTLTLSCRTRGPTSRHVCCCKYYIMVHQ